MLSRFLFCALLAGVALRSQAAELKPESVRAWENFVHSRQTILRNCGSSSIWLCSPEIRSRLRGGEIIVHPGEKKGTRSVSSALIHDWVGLEFIPGTSIEELIEQTRSYSRYPEIYKPSVFSGKTLSRDGFVDHYTITMRQNVLAIRAGLQGQYQTEYHQIDSSNWYSITISTRLEEITAFGDAEQRKLPPDTGNGFIWRLYSSTRYLAADGGVYLELEGAALSRPVPLSLGWFVNPIVERLSRSALHTTLRQTREAVLNDQLSAKTAGSSIGLSRSLR